MSEHNAPAGRKFVSRVAYGDENLETTQLSVPLFDGATGMVTVGGERVVNLGNYESARIKVEVSLPCYPVDEEIVRVADHCSELVAALVNEQIGGLK